LELTKQEARDLVAHKAAKDSRDLTRPQKAEDFKFGLSPNFTPPAGLDFKLDENDPAVGLYRQFALKNEFTQEQFSEGLDLVASPRVVKRTTSANSRGPKSPSSAQPGPRASTPSCGG
jgi:hypothetical protein